MPELLRHQHHQANPVPVPETEVLAAEAVRQATKAAEVLEALEVPMQRKGSLSSMVQPVDSD